MYARDVFKRLGKQPERISVTHIRLCRVRDILNVRKLLYLVLVHARFGQSFIVKRHVIHTVFNEMLQLFELYLLYLRP